MSELLKQAIADAKAVRATALSNAKAALEEHFAPKLQSMLSEKLAAEIAGEEAAAAAPAGAAPAPAPAAPAPAAPAPAAPAPAAPAAAGATDLPPELAPAAPAAPAAPMAEVEEIMKELSDDGETNPPLAERKNAGKKAGNYDKKTSGHKTVDAGQEVVHATKLSTPGGPKAASGSRTASPDYTKKTSGHNTQDPQGASNEMVKLEESDEVNEVNDETLEEILKELEEGMETGVEPQMETTDTTDPVGDVDEVVDINELLGDDPEEEHGEEHDEPSEPSSGPSKMDMPLELDEVDIEALINKGDNAPVAEGDGGDPFDALEEQEAHEETKKENISLKKEIAEYRSAVEFLRSQINEVNLLNAKLLYTNKLFKQVNLNNEQKLKVIESFDLTKSVREAKLVYATLAESINNGAKNAVKVETKPITKTVKNITEGLASKPVASTKPTKPAVIAEGADMASRFKKLAGIRS